MEKKWIHFLFALFGMGVFYLFVKMGHSAWDVFHFSGPRSLILYSVSGVLSAGITFACWRNKKIFSFLSECVDELQKVAWPTWKETMSATLVVICTVVVVSLLLGIFDGVWAYLTRLLYHESASV